MSTTTAATPQLRIKNCEPESVRPIAERYLAGLTAYHLTDGDNSNMGGRCLESFTDLWRSIPLLMLLPIVPRVSWESLERLVSGVLEDLVRSEIGGRLSDDEARAKYNGQTPDEFVDISVEVSDGLIPESLVAAGVLQ